VHSPEFCRVQPPDTDRAAAYKHRQFIVNRDVQRATLEESADRFSIAASPRFWGTDANRFALGPARDLIVLMSYRHIERLAATASLTSAVVIAGPTKPVIRDAAVAHSAEVLCLGCSGDCLRDRITRLITQVCDGCATIS
jgi:hypothetical protein